MVRSHCYCIFVMTGHLVTTGKDQRASLSAFFPFHSHYFCIQIISSAASCIVERIYDEKNSGATTTLFIWHTDGPGCWLCHSTSFFFLLRERTPNYSYIPFFPHIESTHVYTYRHSEFPSVSHFFSNPRRLSVNHAVRFKWLPDRRGRIFFDSWKGSLSFSIFNFTIFRVPDTFSLPGL